MKITWSTIVLIFFFSLTTFAQNSKQAVLNKQDSKERYRTSPRNLKVGDRVPEITISGIINYKSSTVKTSDFNDKLLIIDFWNTHCGSCIAALPRMEALQKEFGDKIMILPVTYEPETLIRDFLSKNKWTKDLVIPSVTNDKVLSEWFKHKYDPNEVWIYKGKVIAITLDDYVTKENIQFVLDGKKNNWPVKNDLLPPFDFKKPLLRVDTAQYTDKNGFLKYSAIVGFREGAEIKYGTSFDSIRNTRRQFFTNIPILGAYYLYWNKAKDPLKDSVIFYPEANRVVLEVSDSSRFNLDESPRYFESWQKQYLYCYESVSPDTGQSEQEQSKAVIRDLNHLLGLNGRFEKRKTKCLVLVRTTAEDKLKSAGGEHDVVMDKPIKKLQNTSLNDLIWKLNKYSSNPPVFDETAYTGNIDMELKINSWTDIPALRKELQRYGLDLKEEERVLSMFVLSENK